MHSVSQTAPFNKAERGWQGETSNKNHPLVSVMARRGPPSYSRHQEVVSNGCSKEAASGYSGGENRRLGHTVLSYSVSSRSSWMTASSVPELTSADWDGGCQTSWPTEEVLYVMVCGMTPPSVLRQTCSEIDQILMISMLSIEMT